MIDIIATLALVVCIYGLIGLHLTTRAWKRYYAGPIDKRVLLSHERLFELLESDRAAYDRRRREVDALFEVADWFLSGVYPNKWLHARAKFHEICAKRGVQIREGA